MYNSNSKQPNGNHQGNYEGKQYFNCEKNHGIFTLLKYIKLDKSDDLNKPKTLPKSSKDLKE